MSVVCLDMTCTSASSCVDHMKYFKSGFMAAFFRVCKYFVAFGSSSLCVWGGAEGFFLLLVTLFPYESVCRYFWKIRENQAVGMSL